MDLPVDLKLAYIYILTQCDHAGIWDFNLELLRFITNAKFTDQEFEEFIGNKLHYYKDDKVYIKGFIEFQYTELSEKSKPHKAVLKILQQW